MDREHTWHSRLTSANDTVAPGASQRVAVPISVFGDAGNARQSMNGRL